MIKKYPLVQNQRIPLIDDKSRPSTYFLNLLIKDKDPKRCKIPTSTDGLIISCTDENDDDLYHPSQCSITCADSSKQVFPMGMELECNPDPNRSENFSNLRAVR